jgi:hypothetical protein
MYLIDNTYFTGKYEIPSILESQSGASELLNQFIEIEVPLFMQGLLGFELFSEFDGYIDDGVLIDSAPQKWQDFVNGITYDGKRWNGFIYSIGTYQKSLLTNLIWCKYLTDKNRIDGNGNANVLDSKNAILGNTANQYYPIYNEFVELVCSENTNGFVSLNEFLIDKRTDYPTSISIN